MCLKIMAFKPWLSSHGCTHFRQFGNIIQRKNSIGLDPPHVSWSIETPERYIWRAIWFDVSDATCISQGTTANDVGVWNQSDNMNAAVPEHGFQCAPRTKTSRSHWKTWNLYPASLRCRSTDSMWLPSGKWRTILSSTWTNGFFSFRWRLSLTPQILATWFWSPSIFY